MSKVTFVEASSADPVVRDLHRRVLRLLNDPALDRQQREAHVRKVQTILIEHQKHEAAKAAKAQAKKALRQKSANDNRNKGVADQSQVVARRKELALASPAPSQGVAVQQPAEPVNAHAGNRHPAANDTVTGRRKRPLLTLKRA